MYVTRHADRPEAALPGLRNRTVAGSRDGLSRLSVWKNTIDPGHATPPHRHDCEEVVVVLRGSGSLVVGEQRIAFGPDSTLVVPPDAPHQIVNDGTEPLELVASFSVTPVRVTFPDGTPLELPWET